MTREQIEAACRSLIERGTKPVVPEVSPLVEAFYLLPNNGAGGSLHTVLDDGNVGDSHVAYCCTYARDRGDTTGEALACVLLLMSKTQRAKL